MSVLTPRVPSAPVCVQMLILLVSLRLVARVASTGGRPPVAQNHHLKQEQKTKLTNMSEGQVTCRLNIVGLDKPTASLSTCHLFLLWMTILLKEWLK